MTPPAEPSTATGSAPPKLNILLIEDSVGDARLLQEFLSDPGAGGFTLTHCKLLSEGMVRLESSGAALVLLDLFLPDSMGIDTFHTVHSAFPRIPIIVMSGLDDESLAIKTVQEGAQDYLVKGQVDSRLLPRAIRYAIERSQTEQALANERDLLHTLLDNLPDRIYFKDKESRFLRISRAVAEHFQLADPRDARGKRDHDFLDRSYADSTLADEQRIIQTGEPLLNKVERESNADGSVTWALTSKMALRDKDHVIIGTFGISRDVTALKTAEDELASERNLLRSLIDNLPDYIYVKDLAGRYILDNVAHQRFMGAFANKEILGKRSRDFLSADLAARIEERDQALFTTGEPLLNHEERVVDPHGNTRWHVTTKVPLRNPRGDVIGLVGIGRDVTERKEAEEKIRETNIELAQSKEELMKVLDDLRQSHEDLKSAQFQLIQAEKMQSVGRLAAGVAHEVKNPLAILGMGIDYLTQNLASPDENVSLILNDMSEALKRADSIILGLLDFSVPHQLDLRETRLEQVMTHALHLVRHELSKNEVQLVTEFDPDLPALRLDANKLQQAFVNILGNAIHAMPNGGTLTLRTQTKTLQNQEVDRDAGARSAHQFRAGDTVVIAEVLDTGTGIDEGKLSRIFDPFFTTKPTGQGTGLGLTVTRKIIELHDGTIEIGNRAERGTRARITFKV